MSTIVLNEKKRRCTESEIVSEEFAWEENGKKKKKVCEFACHLSHLFITFQHILQHSSIHLLRMKWIMLCILGCQGECVKKNYNHNFFLLVWPARRASGRDPGQSRRFIRADRLGGKGTPLQQCTDLRGKHLPKAPWVGRFTGVLITYPHFAWMFSDQWEHSRGPRVVSLTSILTACNVRHFWLAGLLHSTNVVFFFRELEIRIVFAKLRHEKSQLYRAYCIHSLHTFHSSLR